MLTGCERIATILRRRPVDRLGVFEHFWSDTQKTWIAQGHLREDENPADRFGHDMELCWPLALGSY